MKIIRFFNGAKAELRSDRLDGGYAPKKLHYLLFVYLAPQCLFYYTFSEVNTVILWNTKKLFREPL